MYDGKRIIMTRTPLRLSFVGGSTDIPSYYTERGGGAVLSAAMNRYIYITIGRHFHENQMKVTYSKAENDVEKVEDIEHPKVREAFKMLNMGPGLQVIILTEIPSRGTGIGSSSSFTVGLLNALHSIKNESVPRAQLAEESVKIERILKEPGGKQDNYIAAFGGIQLMEFKSDDSVVVRPVKMKKEDMKKLKEHLMLLYTGRERSSAEIHKNQAKEIDSHMEAYDKMKGLAYKGYEALSTGRWREMGKLLHENWMLKKRLAKGITDSAIDKMYETALKHGAEGGKLMGAGGGGFLLLFAPPERHAEILKALPNLKLEHFDFDFDGSKIVYTQE